MKDSGIEWIGEIPENWSLNRLLWCMEEIKEKNNPIQTTNVLSLTNKLGVIPYEEKGNQGNKAKEDYSEYGLAFENTLVINSMNVLIGSVGISKYYGCVSPVYYVFKNTPNSDLRFINYIFQTEQFQKELRNYANGILEIRLRISAHDMLRRLIPYPKLEEQLSISAYLDRQCALIDSVTEKTKASIEEYKKLRQAVITQAVTKGVRGDRPMKDSGIEWIGEIPEEWGTPQIKYVAKIGSGSTPDRNKPEYWNGSIKWLKTGELQNNEIWDSEEYITEVALRDTSVTLFPVNTILMAMYGQGKTRGMTALLKTPCTTNQACAGLQLSTTRITVDYLWRCLMGAYNGIREVAQGSGQPNLNAALISNFHIPLPPVSEQNEIVQYIMQQLPRVDALITKKETFLAELEAYKKSLIYEYVTGKKKVPQA